MPTSLLAGLKMNYFCPLPPFHSFAL